ncbi:MAG TPA: hypothetical protein VJ902_02195, partial [Wenzhouxiangellaceae bacterium]|nr:hypothetical protein [Wenzhouxiangellaceae bacterium]
MSDSSSQGPQAEKDALSARAEADKERREDLARRIRENPDQALKSEFSNSFLTLLEKGRLSVAVSTYQAGQVVFL